MGSLVDWGKGKCASPVAGSLFETKTKEVRKETNSKIVQKTLVHWI